MFISGNAIIDVPMIPEIEADLIQCFKEDDELLLFGRCELTEEDYKYFEELNSKYGEILAFEEKDEFYITKKPISFSYEECYDFPTNTLRTKKLNWYSPDSEEELKKMIADNGITFKCRIVPEGKAPADYEFELYMFEHYLIDDDLDNEHRSLIFEGKGLDRFEKLVLPKIKFILNKKYNI